MAGKLKITQTRSTISHIARNRATVKALGLHGIGSTSVIPDNDATRGMVRQVRFLVSVEEVADEAKASRARGIGTPRSEDRGNATAGHRSEDDATERSRSEETT